MPTPVLFQLRVSNAARPKDVCAGSAVTLLSLLWSLEKGVKLIPSEIALIKALSSLAEVTGSSLKLSKQKVAKPGNNGTGILSRKVATKISSHLLDTIIHLSIWIPNMPSTQRQRIIE